MQNGSSRKPSYIKGLYDDPFRISFYFSHRETFESITFSLMRIAVPLNGQDYLQLETGAEYHAFQIHLRLYP